MAAALDVPEAAAELEHALPHAFALSGRLAASSSAPLGLAWVGWPLTEHSG